jgi:hypothetical protein
MQWLSAGENCSQMHSATARVLVAAVERRALSVPTAKATAEGSDISGLVLFRYPANLISALSKVMMRLLDWQTRTHQFTRANKKLWNPSKGWAVLVARLGRQPQRIATISAREPPSRILTFYQGQPAAVWTSTLRSSHILVSPG